MSRKKTIQEFINESKEVHGNKYNYSNSVYDGAWKSVKIICKKHGEFTQLARNHLNGEGCNQCASILRNQNRFVSSKEFIVRANKVHNNEYEYCDFKGMNNLVTIVHKKCGYTFEQRAMAHCGGQGCPHCLVSKGEKKIEQWLNSNQIKFVPQKRFKDCRNKYPLPFDFYLPEYNTCIEFDGEQHFKPVRFGGTTDKISKKNFQRIKKNDEIKTNFCEQNDILLVRIHYKKIDVIEKVLTKFLANVIL